MWADSLFIHIVVNVIDDRTDIVLELTTMRASRRAALMQHSRTYCNRAAPYHDQSRPPTHTIYNNIYLRIPIELFDLEVKP